MIRLWPLFELSFDARIRTSCGAYSHPRAVRRSAQVVKRDFDVAVSFAALILRSAVMAMIAAATWRSDVP